MRSTEVAALALHYHHVLGRCEQSTASLRGTFALVRVTGERCIPTASASLSFEVVTITAWSNTDPSTVLVVVLSRRGHVKSHWREEEGCVVAKVELMLGRLLGDYCREIVASMLRLRLIVSNCRSYFHTIYFL